MKKERKALALLSGGLDSTLAVKIMIDQGIDITAINFTSPFCNCTPKSAGCRHQAVQVAREFGIPIRVVAKGMDYMRMVENPPHGRGRGMNPCIDCRIYMLKKAREMMADLGASFVITGEVLGQRPMSQRRRQIELIERESGLKGLLLRPLSARNFPPTVPELEGLVDREKLLALSGRSRKAQIDLARDLGIADYPCPAGGCLLTDKVMAVRLKDLFAHTPDYTLNDLHILKIGRHYRISPRFKVILGRNQQENEGLTRLAAPGAILYSPANFPGPTALVRAGDEEDDAMAGALISRYSHAVEGGMVKKQVQGGEEIFFPLPEKMSERELDSFRLE